MPHEKISSRSLPDPLDLFAGAAGDGKHDPAAVRPGKRLILLTSEQRALPMVSIELLIDAGSRHDVAKQEGLANLTARLLTYGTQRRTALKLAIPWISSAPGFPRVAVRISPV